MPREILGDSAGKPYSPGARCGNIVFVSGQLGVDSSGNLVSGGICPETRRALDNVASVLQKAEASLGDVGMVNVYMVDLEADYKAMNEVYLKYFGNHPPARATVGVRELALGARVEISVIATADS